MGCGVACLVMPMTVARRVPRVSRATVLLLGVEASDQGSSSSRRGSNR